MSQFIGRKLELQILEGLFKKQSASLVVIKGRRRIGKSRLIREFGTKYQTFTFSGLPLTANTSKQSQIDEFVRQMRNNFGLPDIKFADWGDAFDFLASQVSNDRTLLVFDEISWIGSKDPDFLGKLKNIWDLKLSHHPKLMLILCGSVSAWIEKNILKSTGFVGRISTILTLNELSLAECSEFLGSKGKHLSSLEKFKIFSITGGIPKYLEEIRPELTAEQNVHNLCFMTQGYLFNEFDQVFSDVFQARSDFYKKALTALTNRLLSAKEICNEIGFELNNHTSDYFDELVQAGFLSRDYTWHLKTQNVSKLSHYRLRDNYVRFYLKYILPNKQKILAGTFIDKPISSLPGWSAIMGLQFENLVLSNRKKIWELLEITPADIIWENPFFQNKTEKQHGCQIDYLIHTKYSNLYVCEIKFQSAAVGTETIIEVQNKIKSLSLPKGFSYRPVLIHVNGVQEEVVDKDYFASILDFGALIV